MNNLMQLEHWYNSLCDGTWERLNGIRITTLPQSGWHVRIDLQGTPFDQAADALLKNMRVSDRDWMTCSIVGHVFEATGGPLMLGPILQIFHSWIAAYTTP